MNEVNRKYIPRTLGLNPWERCVGEVIFSRAMLKFENSTNLTYCTCLSSRVRCKEPRSATVDEQGHVPLDEVCQAYYEEFKQSLTLMDEDHQRRTARMDGTFRL